MKRMKNQKVLLPDGRLVPISRVVYAARLDYDEDAFVWLTHKGDYLLVSEMATPHLVNAVRMLFNHTVPPALRIGKFIRWPDVFGWSSDYKEAAITAMLEELETRDDLERESRYELDDMTRNTEFFLRAMA